MWGSIGRRGKNHGVQGTNASLVKRAMGCGFDSVQGKPFLWHTLPQYGARLLSMIHDELLIESPKRHSKVVAELAADAFLRAGVEVMTKVKMTSDYHISNRWQK
jgi:DNA polymerase I-like protein with 3'-5' exonuclease and polymerase domains